MNQTVSESDLIRPFIKENWPPKSALRLRNISDLVTSCETSPNILTDQSKKCIRCQNTVNEQDSCYLVWEDMCFCDTMCLHWYQKQNLRESCSNCFKILFEGNIGKYVFRFDQLLQFCSIPCFQEYQSKRKSCLYCMGKILNFSYKVSQHDPRYCSQDCVVKHLKVQGVTPNPFFNETPCCICKTKLHPITIQYQIGEELKNICDQFCLQTFILSNTSKFVQCSSCKTFFTQTSLTVKVTYETAVYMFCSKKCETYYVFNNSKVYPCDTCNTTRFDTDLIKRCSKIEPLVYMCSIDCYLKRYLASPEQSFMVRRTFYAEPPTSSRVPLMPMENTGPAVLTPSRPDNLVLKSEKRNTPSPAKNNSINVHCTTPRVKTCFIVKSERSPEQKNVATMCSVQKADKGSCVKPKTLEQCVQTDPYPPKKIIIPVPVPIYVATPMHMYSMPVPTPLPFPLPIPVPIFIPTTRKGTKRIAEDIKKILNSTPNSVEEADVLAIAEAVGIEANKDLENDLALSEQAVNDMFSDDLLESANISNESNDTIDINSNDTTEATCSVLPDFAANANKAPEVEKNILETRLGVHAWRQWLKVTKSFILTDPKNADLLEFSPKELGDCLSFFVSEVRRPNGKKYAPDTLLYLCLSIQKYLLKNDRSDNIFFDSSYKNFVEYLNEQMQTFPLLFLDSAYIITRVEEQHLWESKQLGAHSPYVLLNTILYHNMKYFKLLSVEENMSLLMTSVIKRKHKTDDTKTVLRLYKDNAGHYEMPQNLENAECCPLRLFEFYCAKLVMPDCLNIGLCYFEPMPGCVESSYIWYSAKPLQKNVLEIMLNRLRVVKELNSQLDIED